MMYFDFNLKFLGYGVGFEIKKSKYNFNPNKPNCDNYNGYVKRFEIEKFISENYNPYFVLRLNYNYKVIFRIFLNR